MGGNAKGVCWLCLKRFELSSSASPIIPYEPRPISTGSRLGFASLSSPQEGNESESVISGGGGGAGCYDIYTRFLHLTSRYLKLAMTTEVFLKAAKEYKNGSGENVQAFCDSCKDLVLYICDLYAELQGIKLRLIWKLEEVEATMTSGRKSVSGKLYKGLLKALMDQLKVNSMTRVEMFRKMFLIKCKGKGKELPPKANVPRGLFPEHWTAGYPACKRMMMHLIVVFLLASSLVIVKKGRALEKSVGPPSHVLPQKARCTRSRKKVVIISEEDDLPSKSNDGNYPQDLNTKTEEKVVLVGAKADTNIKTENDNEEVGVSAEMEVAESYDGNEILDSLADDNEYGSPISPCSSEGSDPEFHPTDLKLEENQEPTLQTRWNLRTRRNRKPVVRFTESESDSDSENDKYSENPTQDLEIDGKDLDLEASTTNPKAKIKGAGGRGWPRHGDAQPTLPCPKCKKLFLDKRSLASHLIYTHDTRLSYSCVICGQKFIRWKDLRNHKRSMHRKTRGPKGWSKQPRKCPVCSQVFSTIAALNNHRKKANHHLINRKSAGRPPVPAKCPECSEAFSSTAALRKHRRQEHRATYSGRIRREDGKFKCSKCEEIFPSRPEMELHRRKAHYQVSNVLRRRAKNCKWKGESGRPPLGETKCTRCDKVFPTGKEMFEHRRIEHPPSSRHNNREASSGRFRRLPLEVDITKKCTRCDKAFSSSRELMEHRRKEHPQKRGRQKIPGVETKCTRCDNVFPSTKEMLKHFRTVHPRPRVSSVIRLANEQLQCKYCDATFSTLSEAKVHQKAVHKFLYTKQECPICYRTVVGKERLRYHLKGHENNTLTNIDLWYCEVCSQHFYKEESLNNHMAKSHNNQFSCFVCKEVLESGKLLRDHLATHEKPEKFFHCMICFRGFSSQQYFDLHRKISHSDKRRHHCDYDTCNETLESVELLNAHLKVHAEEAKVRGDSEWSEVYTCTICSKGFIKRYNLTMHELTHTPHNVGRPGYDCPVEACGQTVRYKDTLLTHYNRIHGLGIMPCKCHHCGKAFSSTIWYESHMRNCGGMGGEGVKTGVNQNEHRFCMTCGEQFPNKKELIIHKVNVHQHKAKMGKERTEYLMCPEPGCSEFGTSNQLNVHLVRVHGKGEKIPCHKCGKTFIDMSHLRDHILTHEPGRYKCQLCERRFRKPYEIKRHMEAQHTENREKKYICPECGLSYFTKNGLRFHNWAKHSDGKELPHRCPYCGKGYGRKTLMTLHKKTCEKTHGGGQMATDKDNKRENPRENLKRRKREDSDDEEEMSDKSTTEDDEEVQVKEKTDSVITSRDSIEGSVLATESQPYQGISQSAPYPHFLPQVPPPISYDQWLKTTAAIGENGQTF